MSASVSRSYQQLSMFAEATSIAVATNRSAVRVIPIDPGASHTPIAVVKTTIVVMRGLAVSTRSLTVAASSAIQGVGADVSAGCGLTIGESTTRRISGSETRGASPRATR